jgi:predicted phosphate transport protein (TIGR00153 family)
MTFPQELHEQLRQLLTETIRATNLANKAAEGLNNLVRTGFNDQFVALVEELLLQLHDAEHQTDVSQVTLRKSLFALEHSLKPVDVMFTYKIIELIGDVADSAQTSGNRMMSLIAN